jgi:hypothetical protein
LAANKINADDEIEEPPQPIRGNKISKKNKKKNKNQQDLEDKFTGIIIIIFYFFITLNFKIHLTKMYGLCVQS